MPRYSYKGLDPSGREEAGSVDAPDEATAFALLQSRDISAFELVAGAGHAGTTPWYAREITLGRDRHKLSDQATVAELLGLLAGLNLPANQMLDLAADSAPTPALKRHLTRMSLSVLDGVSLGQSFEEAGQGFNPVFGQVLKTAEAGNALPSAMADLARMLRRSESVRGRISAALLYPALLIVAALAVVLLISLYLAPALAPMFEALGRDTPVVLGLLQRLGQTLLTHGALIAPSAVLALGAVVLLILSPNLAPMRARLLRRLPLIGPILDEGALLRTISALGMLLRGGVSLPEALDGAAAVDRHSPYGQAFQDGAESLRHGGRAVDGLRQHSGLPRLLVSLFAVGEEANQLDRTAQTLSDVLEKSLERRIARAMQLLTPVLTLIIGGGIGILVYSVMGAILDINTVTF